MSFDSPYVIKRILDVFRLQNLVDYVAILDYDGNIKTHLYQNDDGGVAKFEARCISGAKAILGLENKNKKSDQAKLVMISSDSSTEFVCFGIHVIYVLTKPLDDQQKIALMIEKISNLEMKLRGIFESEETTLEKNDNLYSSR